ncbi:MAG: FG-GAP repeat domain-containing protein [Steroidobacteraceae bacterium]
MRNPFDRRGAVVRVLATGTVIAGLTSCGGSSYYTYSAPNSVVIADFNGDGFNDVAIANAYIDQASVTEQPGYVSLLLQNASSAGSYQSSVHFATDGNPSAMAVGDIAGGGSTDLAVANFNQGTISVLLETAPNSAKFQTQISVPIGGLPNDVALCDVDGDGRLDLVVANGDYNGGSLVVIPQTGAGQFGSPETVGTMPTDTADGAPVPDPAYGVACGNFNGDGHSIDVVVTSFYEDLSSGITYGSSGQISVFAHDPSNPGHFLPRIDIPIYGLLHRVAIADVNGDGLPDIIVANEGPGSDLVGTAGAAVLLQTTAAGAATPTFADPVTFATDSAVSIAVGDINGDGMPDIVIASGYQNADAVEVMLNTTTKGSTTVSFGAAAPYAGLGNPSAVAIGDLNHDGLTDIGSADGTGAGLYFQQSGSSAGTFVVPVEVGS